MKKRVLFLLLVLAISAITIPPSLRKKPGFALSKVRSSFTYSPQWRIPPLNENEHDKLMKILSQDFNYLGSGAQCYAFISADGKYVLKFFKIKHLTPKRWLNYLPLPGLSEYRFRKVDKRILRHKELFSSYFMAYNDLKEETGLVYIHLNKTKDTYKQIRLFDRMRKCYHINLSDYEFVLQRKAQLVRDRIDVFMQRQEPGEAIAALSALLNQVVLQCKKGFIDGDSGISHNYGFIDGKVIHFDVGRIRKSEEAKSPSFYHREVLRVGKKLERWLSVFYPTLLYPLEEEISHLMDLSPSGALSPQQSQ